MTPSPPFEWVSPAHESGLRLSIKIIENDQGVRFSIAWPTHQHIKENHFFWKNQGQPLPTRFWNQKGRLQSTRLEGHDQMTFQSPSVWMTSEHPLKLEWMVQGCSDQGFCYFPQAFKIERSAVGSSWTMQPIPFSH